MSNAFDAAINNQVIRSSSIKSVLAGGGDIKTILMKMVNLSDDGVFHDDDCPICKSQYRSHAEKEWATSRNADVVRQIFIDKGEQHGINVIKHHMDNHFGASAQELRKKEYIDRLSHLSGTEMSTMDKLDLNLNALHERLVTVNSINDPELPDATVEKIRTELTCKIVATTEKLLQFRANMLGEMRQNGEVFTIDKKEFASMFASMLQTAKSHNEQVMINMIFGRLHEICKEY